MDEATDYKVYAVLMSSRGERANNPSNAALGANANADPLWQSPMMWDTSTTPATKVANNTANGSTQPYPGTQF
jgi:hypothetical protein